MKTEVHRTPIWRGYAYHVDNFDNEIEVPTEKKIKMHDQETLKSNINASCHVIAEICGHIELISRSFLYLYL